VGDRAAQASDHQHEGDGPAGSRTLAGLVAYADWDDFDDRTEMQRRLPRLTALCWPDA